MGFTSGNEIVSTTRAKMLPPWIIATPFMSYYIMDEY